MKALVFISSGFEDVQKVYATFVNLMKRGYDTVAVDNKGIHAAKMAGMNWVRALPENEIDLRMAFVRNYNELPHHLTQGFVFIGESGEWREVAPPPDPHGEFECTSCSQRFVNKLDFIPKLCPTCYRWSKLPADEQWAEGPPSKWFGIHPRYFRPEIVDEYKDTETGEDVKVIGDYSEEDNQVYMRLIDGEAGYDGFSDDDPDLDFQREAPEELLEEEMDLASMAEAMNAKYHV